MKSNEMPNETTIQHNFQTRQRLGACAQTVTTTGVRSRVKTMFRQKISISVLLFAFSLFLVKDLALFRTIQSITFNRNVSLLLADRHLISHWLSAS